MGETLHGAEDICQQMIIGRCLFCSKFFNRKNTSQIVKAVQRWAKRKHPNIDELTERNHIADLNEFKIYPRLGVGKFFSVKVIF